MDTHMVMESEEERGSFLNRRVKEDLTVEVTLKLKERIK
jgi:hypothetical protein